MPARWLSPTALECAVPARPPGPVLVGASNNGGVEVSAERRAVLLYPLPALLSLSPPTGSTAGGTRVRLRGAGFLRTPALACRFGAAADVPATWVSAHEVECVSPSAPRGAVDVALTLNGQVTLSPRPTPIPNPWPQAQPKPHPKPNPSRSR